MDYYNIRLFKPFRSEAKIMVYMRMNGISGGFTCRLARPRKRIEWISVFGILEPRAEGESPILRYTTLEKYHSYLDKLELAQLVTAPSEAAKLLKLIRQFNKDPHSISWIESESL